MQTTWTALSLAICVALAGCSDGSHSSKLMPEDNNIPSPTEPTLPEPSIPTPEEPNTPEEPTSPPAEKLTLLDDSRFTDIASELNPKAFNVSLWDPRAVALHGNVLYIANAGVGAKILRYDFTSKTVLPAIDPTELKLSQAWDTVNDIHIADNRLYVASHSTNRVDIFDLSATAPKFIMSLGTGNWWGDQNYAMVHSHAVAANSKYVFSADIENRINVWQQSDVTAAKHLKAQKFARLSLPNCGRYCTVHLETVGDYLYAGLSNGETYVYDTTKITQANDIAPSIKQTALASNYHLAQDGLWYAKRANGSIASFKASQISLKNLLPNAVNSVSSYRLSSDTSATSLAQANDFAIYNNHIIAIANKKLVTIPLRRMKQQKSAQVAQPLQLKNSQAISESRMLQDGESWETLTNVNQRHVFMNKILSTQLDADGISLQSYSATPVTDLELHAKLKNSDQWVVLAKIDRLEAFSKTKFKLDINAETRLNLVDGSGSIQLQGLDKFKQIPADLFDFKIDSKTDQHVKKLNSIKAQWKIYFGTYNQDADSKWRRINPLYAREWVIMMTNFAYMLSSPEFEKIWFNHKAVMGHDFFGNAGNVQAANGIFSEADYKRVYQEILNRGGISLGITSMGGGLGGGAVLGVDTWIYYGHYRLSGYGLMAHEFGHHWGSHNSAWANGGYGFQPMMDNLNFYFQRQNGSLPYMDPSVNNFHNAPASQLYAGVNQNMVNGVAKNAPINAVDRYFAANPLGK